MGKVKDFFRDLKVFLAYVVTRPFVEIWEMLKMFYIGSGNLDRPYFWVKAFGMLTLFLLVVGFKTEYWAPSYVAAAVTFIALLRFEWISGRFRKWHTDRIKARAKRIQIQTEQEGK